LRVTVVGSSSSIPRPDRACSSYLVQDDETSLVLDLGTGAFANLRRHVDYNRLDAIVISHMHADHFIDLIPLRYALCYGPFRRKHKLPLYLPPDGERMLHELVGAFADEGGGDFISEVFDVRTYDPARTLAIGGGEIRFALTSHYIPAFAMRYRRGGQSFTYSADTAPEERIVRLASGSDLFICESTLLADDVERGMRGHSSGREAGEMARAAGVGRLVLTHYAECATARDLDEGARAFFEGEIIVADDHRVLEVAAPPHRSSNANEPVTASALSRSSSGFLAQPADGV
jgi:ribonuclease BN (tRNA processing enzyme)